MSIWNKTLTAQLLTCLSLFWGFDVSPPLMKDYKNTLRENITECDIRDNHYYT